MDSASADARLAEMAAAGTLIAYFGYGSLVNPYTHRTEIVGYRPARLQGWRRRWQARPDIHPDPIALLSSSPVGGDRWLDGLLVFDHIDNLPALDAREAGYDRRVIEPGQLAVDGAVPVGCPIYAYEGHVPAKPDVRHFILQSYLDAVLQGYFLIYGAEAVAGFVAETGNFDTPILRDRGDPRYPRHVSLDPVQRAVIDAVTADLNFVDGF